jgi:Transcriptional regulatory protein, C terminal
MPVPIGDPAHGSVRFAEFELDLTTGELWKGTERVVLPDQLFRILSRLVREPGALVTRDELRREAWAADTHVDFEHGLNAAIKRLRETLGARPRPRSSRRCPGADTDSLRASSAARATTRITAGAIHTSRLFRRGGARRHRQSAVPRGARRRAPGRLGSPSCS